MQLLRIGRNLNQAMKAANAAMLDTGDKRIEPELRRIADMRMEISEQVTAVGDAMRGDASYWTVAARWVLNRPCGKTTVRQYGCTITMTPQTRGLCRSLPT